MSPPRAAALLLAVCCAALPAQAGSMEDPEVTDPRGDVQHLGAPVPAGFEWGDVVAAWFEAANGTLTLHIEVAGTLGPPAQGEVGVTFQVGNQSFIAGWTVFPPFYSGGFLSRSDAAGDVPSGVQPESAEATWTASHIAVTIPLARVDPNGTAGGLEGPNGWSESQATNGRMYRLDETAAGHPFRWGPEATVAPPPAQPEGASAASPALPAGLALALLVGLAARRRRPRL